LTNLFSYPSTAVNDANINFDSTLYSNSRTRAPFKPQKSGRGTTSWQLKQFAEATLGSGSLRKAVKLPEGEDEDEWLAVNGAICLKHIKDAEADLIASGRFLQPDQPALWVNHRVLFTPELSRDEGDRRVCYQNSML
jgi:hypothetical protein